MANAPLPTPLIVADPYLSVREAYGLLLGLIRAGEGDWHYLRELPKEEVWHTLDREGYPLLKVVEDLQRDPRASVPRFDEARTVTSYTVYGMGKGKIEHFYQLNDVAVKLGGIDGEGSYFYAHPYLADFDKLLEGRDEALRTMTAEPLGSAVAAGFTAIESFFKLQEEVYASKTGVRLRLQKRGKAPQGKSEIERKIEEFLPQLAPGAAQPPIQARPGAWPAFARLRGYRNAQIHGDYRNRIRTVEQLAEAINDFRDGFAWFLAALHKPFGLLIPQTIIRAQQYPTVRVVRPVL